MWQLAQLEKLHEIEPDIVNNAIAELWEKETVLKEKMIIGEYLDEDINFGKIDELLGVHPVKRIGLFRKRFCDCFVTFIRNLPVYVLTTFRMDLTFGRKCITLL
ncbi:MAG TPA: hypothetical protein VFF47_06785 [Nitrospirota bacterium]|nr:hypothetical protein [Nitrospirota bacterium]